MTSTVETAAEIRSFDIDVPQEELDDLRRRLAATRWPESETVDDASQGVQLATIQELAAKGGHFAAWEEPELFASEMRAAFKSIRDEGRSS